MSPSGVDLKLVELLEGIIRLNTQDISVLRGEIATLRLEIERIKVKVAIFASLFSIAVNAALAIFNHYKP